jgi:nitrogen-specific signal transduction histidine kinase
VSRLLLIADDAHARPFIPVLSANTAFQVQIRPGLAEARAAIEAGAFDAIILAPATTDSKTVQHTAAVRAAAPRLLLVVVLPSTAPASVQAHFLAAGADLVPPPPTDLTALAATLSRLTVLAAPSLPTLVGVGSTQPFPVSSLSATVPAPNSALASALEVLRDFSKVLGYSLDYRQLTQQFVLKLREVIGVARIAVFLEPPASGTLEQGGEAIGREAGRLVCAAAAGLPRDLLDCVELTRRGGIGLHVTRRGQVLRLDEAGGVAAEDLKIAREFEILGCEVALPVNDRERALGVALLGGRVTGGAFTDAELRLVYHLLEELGLALKNSWLHDQLTASHRLFGDVLGAITSGSLVVSADLRVLHANRVFLQFLRGGEAQPGRQVEFAELPPALAAALHDLVEKDRLAAPFFVTAPDQDSGRNYRISLVPFPNPERRLPQPALAIIEDFTQIQAAQRTEIEASNARLLALIAKRFAHEIRNALVPLTTHHQLLDADYGSHDFRDSLKIALGRETSRIQRFTEQMLYLSQPACVPDEFVQIAALLTESHTRAARSLSAEGRLELTGDSAAGMVRAHRASLAHALEEIFLNGLQAAPAAVLKVQILVERDAATGQARLFLRFRDAGPGLAPEVANHASEPFFTTRNTGVGLGLTVARRIIEQHAGRIEVRARTGDDDPDVILHLPLP